MFYDVKQPNFEYVLASCSPYTKQQITSLARANDWFTRVDHTMDRAVWTRFTYEASLGSISSVLSSPVNSRW